VSDLAREQFFISQETVSTYAAFHRELSAHLKELADMTRKYPVEVQFQGLRFVFDSEDEIHRAISLIASSIERYRAAGGKVGE